MRHFRQSRQSSAEIASELSFAAGKIETMAAAIDAINAPKYAFMSKPPCVSREHAKLMPIHRSGSEPLTIPPGQALAGDSAPQENPRAWIRLPSGRHLDLVNPQPDAWLDCDLAARLSRTYRWGGESTWPVPLSVAQHSLSVLALRRAWAPSPLSPGEALLELLHDAEEGFLGDCIRPQSRAGPTVSGCGRAAGNTALSGEMQSAKKPSSASCSSSSRLPRRQGLVPRHGATPTCNRQGTGQVSTAPSVKRCARQARRQRAGGIGCRSDTAAQRNVSILSIHSPTPGWTLS